MSRAVRVARNVSWSLFGQAGIAVANFILIPRLVHGFGIEDYGLYLLMFAAVSYVQLLTFGAGAGVVRYVAERRAAGDPEGVRDTLRHGFLLHLCGSALGATALWIAAPWAVTAFFQVPARLHAPGIAIIRAGAVAAVFSAGAQCAQCALQGFQRFDWFSISSLAQGLFMPLGVAVLLFFGKGLRAAGIWFVAMNAASFALSAAFLRRETPARHKGEGLPFREFTWYSLGMWVGVFAWIMSTQLDKLFIARKLALSTLTLYAVPLGLLQRLQILPATVAGVFMPMVTEARGEGSAEDLRRMFGRATRMLAGFLLPVYLGMFALMPQFLSLWLGGRFGAEGVWPARLLVLAHMIGFLVYLPHAVSAGRGVGWWASALSWGQAITSLVFWPILIPRYGILGAAAGTLAAQALPAFFYVRAINSLMDLSWGRYLREALRAPALAGAVMITVIFPIHHMVGGWASLIGLSALGAAVYGGVFWLALPKLDRDFVLTLRPVAAVLSAVGV